jgi:hypothetical protein
VTIDLATDDQVLQYNPHQLAFLDALAAKTPEGKRSYNRLVVFSGRQGGKTRVGGIAAAREAAVPGTLGWEGDIAAGTISQFLNEQG